MPFTRGSRCTRLLQLPNKTSRPRAAHRKSKFAHLGGRQLHDRLPSTCQPVGNTADQTPIRVQYRISIYRDRGAGHGSTRLERGSIEAQRICALAAVERPALAYQQGNNASDEPERSRTLDAIFLFERDVARAAAADATDFSCCADNPRKNRVHNLRSAAPPPLIRCRCF